MKRSDLNLAAGVSLLAIALAAGCSGFTKLNIPGDAFKPEMEFSQKSYTGNHRQNSSSTDVAPPYQEVWSKKYRSAVTDHPLAVDRFLVLTQENGMVAFFDIENGEKTGDGHMAPGFRHAPVLSDNKMYYAANLGRETLGAFSLEKMKKVWEIQLPHLTTAPLLTGNRILVGSNSGKFFCVSKENGEKQWEFDAGYSILGNPAGDAGRIYLANIKGTLFCVEAVSGKLLWQRATDTNVYAGPLLAEDKVFIGSTSGKFFALSQKTGDPVWEIQTGGSIYGNAAYRDGIIYIGNNNHVLNALKASDGRLLWQFTAKGVLNTPPLAGPKFLYLCSWDKNLYVLDRLTGQVIYRRQFKRSIKSSPLIYKNRLYLHVANDRLYCLEHKMLTTKLESSDE